VMPRNRVVIGMAKNRTSSKLGTVPP